MDYQIIPADQYFNVLKTKLNAGEATDIFGGQAGKSDLEVQYDVTNNAVDLSDQEWVKRHDPLALDQVSLNGKVYAAEIWDTVGNNYWVMVYNKAIFQQLGLSVPKTYAEFKAVADKIKAAGITPIYEPISDGWHQVLWFPEDGPRYEELNPGLADQLNANKTTFADSKTMLQALQQLQEMYKSGYFGDNTMSDAYADANKTLAGGKYAMMDRHAQPARERCARFPQRQGGYLRLLPDSAAGQSAGACPPCRSCQVHLRQIAAYCRSKAVSGLPRQTR